MLRSSEFCAACEVFESVVGAAIPSESIERAGHCSNHGNKSHDDEFSRGLGIERQKNEPFTKRMNFLDGY